ncbi:MAG: TRAP transporter substrate-binding protein [Gammaproteobacteria bacterium]|nr:TRAP transporter substrate-binding protein [Gammaproteobacteria bacterium]MBT8444977.1 TRAP transporter substrate-binding protein [Gammaproteobacteria bacterium]NND35824.1 TRAP transporter substrate-binding protein [Gammaproteobacteria bacterium]
MSNSNYNGSDSLRAATALFVSFVLAAAMTGCGGEADPASDDSAKPAARIVNLGGTTVPDTPGEAVWLAFEREAESASGGSLDMRPLIYGQLGSEEQLLSGLRRGRIQFANLSAQVTSTVVAELALLYAPFLFDSAEEADYVYDNYLTDIYRELLAAKNLHLLTWYEIGFHSVYAKEPIIMPTDAAGKRFRVSSSLNARLFAEAIGADVIPLGFGEIVSGLQTGLIEAGENSISLYARTGIADEAPEYTQTKHAFGVSVIVADQKWWKSLDASERSILSEAFPTIDESRRLTRQQDEIDLRDPEVGIRAHDLTPEQRKDWKRATAGVTKKLIDALGGRSGEIYDVIQKGKAEFAAR